MSAIVRWRYLIARPKDNTTSMVYFVLIKTAHSLFTGNSRCCNCPHPRHIILIILRSENIITLRETHVLYCGISFFSTIYFHDQCISNKHRDMLMGKCTSSGLMVKNACHSWRVLIWVWYWLITNTCFVIKKNNKYIHPFTVFDNSNKDLPKCTIWCNKRR